MLVQIEELSDCFAYPRCACFAGGPPKVGWSCSMLVEAGGPALQSSLMMISNAYDQARKSGVAIVDSRRCCCRWCCRVRSRWLDNTPFAPRDSGTTRRIGQLNLARGCTVIRGIKCQNFRALYNRCLRTHAVVGLCYRWGELREGASWGSFTANNGTSSASCYASLLGCLPSLRAKPNVDHTPQSTLGSWLKALSKLLTTLGFC